MYAPVKSCIYCGRTDTPLTREHIIPFSLGGNAVLPAASCAEHATLTSTLEREVARVTYGVYRAMEGVQSRRKGNLQALLQKDVLLEGEDFNGKEVEVRVRLADVPPMPLIVRLPIPGILAGSSPDADGGFTAEIVPHAENTLRPLREKLGLAKLHSPSTAIRPVVFVRVLAKIAHCFATAELGLGAFEPWLLPLILGVDVSGSYLVGGFQPELPQSKSQLCVGIVAHGGEEIIIVEISLHFFPKLPRYQVVCGVVRQKSH